MIRAILLFSTVAFLFAQTKTRFEYCGLGSHHECHCIDRVQKIHQLIYEKCEHATSNNADFDKCIKALQKTHCSIAESLTEYDGEMHWDSEKDEYVGESKMGPMCTMACKPHDCKCDDGPTCHFGHDASDHK